MIRQKKRMNVKWGCFEPTKEEYGHAGEMQMKDTYPDKSLEQEYDDAERAAIEKADRMLDDEKNRIQEDEER